MTAARSHAERCPQPPAPTPSAAGAATGRQLPVFDPSDVRGTDRGGVAMSVKTSGRNSRAIPDDFAALAPTMRVEDLMRHYSAGTWTVHRWIKEIGGRDRVKRILPPRPVPADFADHAPHESNTKLLRRYNCGHKLLYRWRRETGIPADTIHILLPAEVPDGFALVAPDMTMHELRERYGRAAGTIRKWCRATGVTPRRAERRVTSPRAVMIGNAERRFTPLNTRTRDMSRAGQAATFLQRLGPVYRCDASGRQDPKGTRWNRGGRTILTDAELIERAERNGWAPDAWRDLAA